MTSTMLPARMVPLILLLLLPGCALFAPARVTVAATPSACSTLLPEEWLEGVESADLENSGATIGDWIKFGDAQTGQLDKANDRYKAAVGVVSRCEVRDAAAIKPKRFLGMF